MIEGDRDDATGKFLKAVAGGGEEIATGKDFTSIDPFVPFQRCSIVYCLQVKISNYGTPGGYLIGTYSGPVKDSTTSAIVNLTGTFRVKI